MENINDSRKALLRKAGANTLGLVPMRGSLREKTIIHLNQLYPI